MSKESKSTGKFVKEALSKGTKNQKEIKKYISGLSDLNQELINPIIRKNVDKVTPLLKLKEKFIKEGKDADFLAAHIEIVEKFQSTNSKKFNKAQLKNVNNYLGVLRRISNGWFYTS
jgi:Glu-tRNA(Gln) amidotransferase subunit E-like FAD-binding protein